MLHLLYVLAFTVIAFLAVSNLIRSLITVSMDSQRRYSTAGPSNRRGIDLRKVNQALHPELLDENGKPIDEPLLVVRSVSVEDARQQLDALYNSSAGQPKESEEEA